MEKSFYLRGSVADPAKDMPRFPIKPVYGYAFMDGKNKLVITDIVNKPGRRRLSDDKT